jgi:hypothetical protein
LFIGQDQRSVRGTGLRQRDRFTVRRIEALMQFDPAAKPPGRELALYRIDMQR